MRWAGWPPPDEEGDYGHPSYAWVQADKVLYRMGEEDNNNNGNDKCQRCLHRYLTGDQWDDVLDFACNAGSVGYAHDCLHLTYALQTASTATATYGTGT